MQVKMINKPTSNWPQNRPLTGKKICQGYLHNPNTDLAVWLINNAAQQQEQLVTTLREVNETKAMCHNLISF